MSDILNAILKSLIIAGIIGSVPFIIKLGKAIYENLKQSKFGKYLPKVEWIVKILINYYNEHPEIEATAEQLLEQFKDEILLWFPSITEIEINKLFNGIKDQLIKALGLKVTTFAEVKLTAKNTIIKAKKKSIFKLGSDKGLFE